jgi:Protein of unknown function (DUF2934)
MRLFNFFKNQKLLGAPQPAMAGGLKQKKGDFTLPPEEVAKRAYFNYVNHGSRPGHDLTHWLEARAQLLAERNSTRITVFTNWTK